MNFNNSSHHAGPKKLKSNLSENISLKLFSIKEFIYPAGKQIQIPRKKTKAIDPFGSLNLSDRKKYSNIKIDGTIVINNVLIILYHPIILSPHATVLLQSAQIN
tara:strand:+ start:265 stop:576 length:312 start_codon:yes stop_codon:yes gene_type:complete